jgi:integrase
MARICEAAGIKDLHLHDMRKGLTTWLREVRREREDVIEAILHHSQRGARAHYDFATLERRCALPFRTGARSH